jgi:hypothetical protein
MARRQKRPVEFDVIELMTKVSVLEMLVAILLADKLATTNNPKMAGENLLNQAIESFDAAQGEPNRTSMEMGAVAQRIVHRAISAALRSPSSEK